MTRSARLTALGVGLLLIPALSQTQAQPPGRRPGGDAPRAKAARPGAQRKTADRPVRPLLAALDTNNDGELSKEEIGKASEALLTLDHNRDGVIDRTELESPPGGREGRTDGPPPPRDGGRGGRGGPEGFDGPPPGGPDGPPPGGPGGPPPRGGRRGGPGSFDGPPPRGPGGPEGPEGPPRAGRRGPGGPGGPGGGPEIGHVLPPFARRELNLTEDQRKKIGDLEAEVKTALTRILRPEQIRELRELLERGPGGPPEGPGGPPPGDDDRPGPPERPRRPD